jgi:hypothetical protein
MLDRPGFTLILFVCFSVSGISVVSAEDLEPRRWAHLPVDTHFVGAGYGRTHADVNFDPVLKIENAELELDSWAVKYIRTFELFEKTARFDVAQGYQQGRWNGLLDGEPAEVQRNGLTDTIVRVAINFQGAPALGGKAYAEYRAANKDENVAGMGLSVQLPSGEYMDDKLINIGSNRYTFRPQVGMMQTWGAWSLESTAWVVLYSDNTNFYNGKRLENDPLYVASGHLIYTYSPGVWASLSAGYDRGGRSTVDGVKKDDEREDLLFALSLGVPINRNMSVKLAYIAKRSQQLIGVDSDTFALGLSANW